MIRWIQSARSIRAGTCWSRRRVYKSRTTYRYATQVVMSQGVLPRAAQYCLD